MLLPPNVFLVFRSHGGQEVVSVHDDVNHRVDETEEGAVTTGDEFDTPPAGGRHDTVMNHVQGRNLVVFLA